MKERRSDARTSRVGVVEVAARQPASCKRNWLEYGPRSKLKPSINGLLLLLLVQSVVQSADADADAVRE